MKKVFMKKVLILLSILLSATFLFANGQKESTLEV
jgi:hypothetical protein